MRVLYVTEGFPYPLTSGGLRHYYLIRGLAERHQVHLLSTAGGDTRPEHIDAMRQYCSAVATFRSTAGSSMLRKVSAQARDMVIGRGEAAAARALATAAREEMARSKFDAIVLNGRSTATVLDQAGSTPVIVDLCDAVSLRLRGQLAYTSGPGKAAVRIKLRRMREAEARLVAAGRHVLFASQRDLEAALSDAAAHPPSTVLPNGVDTDFWHRSQGKLGSDVVLSGAMHYPPNDDAARYLAESIMPKVWETKPGARLRVIGLNPTRALRDAAHREPRVAVTGYVDDVRPHLELGAVYAAPLRFASGIQNKLLEAMAMELPVVTSNLAADGLRTREGDALPLVVAGDADEFASAIVTSLDAVERDSRPLAASRSFVRERFAWSESVAILERVLAEVTRGR
jgi:polysaccharide biosynthesis protein PslH